MLIIGSILLLLANAVTLRREKSILFNRVAILILLKPGILGYDSLAIGSLDRGIGVFSGLFHSTAITHSFYIFIYIAWEEHSSVPTYMIVYFIKVYSAPFLRSQTSFTSRRILSNSSLAMNAAAYLVSGQRAYSTSANQTQKLNPYFITGFVDGEGYFHIKICKGNRMKLGLNVHGVFGIVVHKKDQAILELIQQYFNGVGSITKNGKDAAQYQVGSLKDLALII